jgi:hypothetical protein
MNIGAKSLEQLRDVILTKNDDEIDALECRHELGTIGSGQDRPLRSFELSGHLIVVHTHDEDIAQRFRAFEITNVADVEQIEMTVRENNPLTRALRRCDARRRFGCVDNVAHDQR